MPIAGLGSALPALGAGLLGAVAGGAPKQSSQTSQLNLAPASDFEQQQAKNLGMDVEELRKLLGSGAGQQDVTAALGSQRGLADMLQNFAQGGFMPSQAEQGQANAFAQSQFAPQQQALQTAFQQQNVDANRLAQQLGRPVDDPVVRNMLARQQTQQQGQLSAQQGAFASQFAQNLPMQRLGFQGQLADVQGNLASQALQNRQSMLQMGNMLQQQERQFRLQSAGRTVSSQEGGGASGAMAGALAGMGSPGLNSGLSSIFGGIGSGLSSLFSSTPAGQHAAPTDMGTTLGPATPMSFSAPGTRTASPFTPFTSRPMQVLSPTAVNPFETPRQ